MATPHDDAPPAHEPDCLPPEPCVCAGLRATADTVTTADLDLVDRLDREATPEPWTAGEEDEDGIVIFAGQGRGHGVGELWNARRGPDSRFIAAARTLLPRLARSYRFAMGMVDEGRKIVGALNERIIALESAERDAYARGRREAIEGGVRFLRTDEGSASAADDLEQWERERREERGSK